MKKRIMAFVLVVTLLFTVCPVLASASYSPPAVFYENYTAIGDSISAGFSQPDYNYDAVWDVRLGITESPAHCYAKLAGDALGSNVFNLGKCGSDSIDLLDVLTDESNEYYDVYRQYIGSSDLITLEIGGNDLLFSAIRSVLACINPAYGTISNAEIMEAAAPFFTGEVILTGDFEQILAIIHAVIGTELTDEQIAAIAVALSDEALTATLTTAYNTYCANFQQIIPVLRAINPTAELLILNYFNPYPDLNFRYGELNYNIGSVLQGFTDQMNAFALSYCQSNGYVYVDISDTQTTPGDAHPSAAGHASIACKIVDALLSTITATAETGGSINPSGDIIAKRHDSFTFTISPDSGYMINTVYLDGVKLDGSTLTALTDGEYSYTLSDITKDHTINATFVTEQAPELSITGGNDLDFGWVFPGYTSPDAQTVTIENTGVQTVDLSLPSSSSYTFALDDMELDPGESTTLTVQPKAGLSIDDYSGTIYVGGIGEYGSGSATTPLDLSFAVVGHTYLVSGSPTILDFGSIVEGYTASPDAKTVAITNDGNTAVTLTAPTSDHYIFTLSATALAPGETVQLTVQPKTGLAWANYDETIVIQGTDGASASIVLKFTVEEDYKNTTKTDAATGVTVSGLMRSNAQLVVGALTLVTDAGSNSIRALKDGSTYNYITGWNIKLTGDFKGSFVVTIPVGDKYNGQTVTILHAAASGLKTYSTTVKNGVASIIVTEFSPFAVFIKAADNSPGTGDTSSNFIWLLLAGGSIVGAIPVFIAIKHRRKKD